LRLSFVFKKTLRASELEREDIVRSRNEWAEFQHSVDPARLVFLDEYCMGAHIKEPGVMMPRLAGIGKQRCEKVITGVA
jgi:hypothetical protein